MRNKILYGALLFGISFLALYAIGYGYFIYYAQVLPSNDLAAEMLLENTITNVGYLLTGHPSRFGFHHPGPFFYYFNHLFEIITVDSTLSRAQVWILANECRNSLFLTIAALCVVRLIYPDTSYREKSWKPFVSGVAFVITIICCLNMNLILLWAPYYLLAPYLAFLITIPFLLQEKVRILPLSVLLTCILIHGYATMISLTLPLLAITWIYHAFMEKKILQSTTNLSQIRTLISFAITKPLFENKWIVLSSGLICLLFIAPMLIDLWLYNPSNLSLLIAAKHAFAKMPHPSLSDIIRVIYHNLAGQTEDAPHAFRSSLGPCVFILIGLLLIKSKFKINEHYIQALKAFIYAIVTVFILLLLTYKGTPKPLYDYTMSITRTLAPLILSIGLLGLIQISFQSTERCWLYMTNTTFLMSILTSLVLIASSAVYLYGANQQNAVQEAIKNGDTPTYFVNYLKQAYIKDPKLLTIEQASNDEWPMMTGLLLELHAQKIPSCAILFDPFFKIGYTPEEICSTSMKAQWKIVNRRDCDQQKCVVKNNIYGLVEQKET